MCYHVDMGLIAWAIVFVLLLHIARRLFRRLLMLPPPAPAPAEATRPVGHMMEGLGEVLPLGNQVGWHLAPPPPSVTIEEVEDAHNVVLSEAELAALKGEEL